jgi:hypothetical protein
MPDIFGANIAGKLNSAMGSKLFAVTLVQTVNGVRTPGDSTAGTNPVATTYTGRGFVDDYTTRQIDGTIIRQGDRKVSILGASLPAGVVPRPGDRTTIEGEAKAVINVTRDPAGALYECQVR